MQAQNNKIEYKIKLHKIFFKLNTSYTKMTAISIAKDSSVKRVIYETKEDASVATIMKRMRAVQTWIQKRNER